MSLLWFLHALLLMSIAYVDCIYVEDANPFFRKDYEFNADTQNFYKVHTATRTWTDAKARCELEGASLFVADSKQDQEAAAALLKTKLQAWDAGWTGIHDQFAEADFVTIDGLSIDEVYHQWDQWEPNNANNEDCVLLRKNAKNNDADCATQNPFICKKSRSSVKWNAFCDIPDKSYLYNKDLGRCYKFHLKPKTWTEAYGVCAAEQSYLTVINSKAEAEHLVKMVADAPKDKIRGNYVKNAVYIGIHNQLDEGFTTIQGIKLEDTGYAVWGAGQPDNAGGHEKCGAIFYDGTLNDIPCDLASIFVCEHDVIQLSVSIEERVQSDDTANVTKPHGCTINN